MKLNRPQEQLSAPEKIISPGTVISMKYLTVISFIVALGICAMPIVRAQSATDTDIQLQVGDVKVLSVADLSRVAVGNGRVVNAVTDADNEIVLFAREPGETVVNIWDKNNGSQQFHVQVRAVGEQRLQHDIRRILSTIGHIKATQVGEKIIVEGDNLSDADRERLMVLARHFPQIVDMTSQIGWDQMVLLDVQILELPRNVLQELGIKWNTNAGGLAAGAVWDSGSSRFSNRPGDGPLQIPFRAAAPAGYFGLNALLSASVQTLAQQGQAVVLAQPQLMARSGSTAEFLAGGEVPYVTTDRNGQNQTIFKPYGVSLHITPRIQKNGNVRSKIDVEVSSVDASMTVNGGPALKTRRTSTEFNVQSGQTLVLAGFISRDQFRNAEKLPGLGDLPVLGALFRSSRFQRNETELAIFVRPVVVSADNHDLLARTTRSREIIDDTFRSPPVLNVPVSSETQTKISAEPNISALANGDLNTFDGARDQEAKAQENRSPQTPAAKGHQFPIWVPAGEHWHFSRGFINATKRADAVKKLTTGARRTVPIRVKHSRWKPVLRLQRRASDSFVTGGPQ